MSNPQLGQLEALLATVQKNRLAARTGSQVSADGSVASGTTSSGHFRAAAGSPPEAPSARKPAAPERRAAAVEVPYGNERTRQEPASVPAQANQPLTPRMIDPDPPRQSTRPIAQLVSKHVPAVDATFGAMLKRSLSLRPH
jgi:hypothetical protein